MATRISRKTFLKGCAAMTGIAMAVNAAEALREFYSIKLTNYEVKLPNLPVAFDGFTIAHVSDLHNAPQFAPNGNDGAVLELVKSMNPQLIALTGDLIDSRYTNYEIGLAYAGKLTEVAPVLYVSGNHERRPRPDQDQDLYELIALGLPAPEETTYYAKLAPALADLGVVLLDDNAVAVDASGQVTSLDDVANLEGSRVLVQGIRDSIGYSRPAYYQHLTNLARATRNTLNGAVARAVDETENNDAQNVATANDFELPSILLAHRPEHFEAYVREGYNLVLSGHTHGGQLSIAGLQALYVPNQGFFPRFDAGKFLSKHTTMIISKGIGTSVLPVRIGAMPEVVRVTLRAPEAQLS